jgi:hypothetical protein
VTSVDNVSVTNSRVEGFIDPPYPIEFNNLNVNPNFESATSGNILSVASINDAILYPGQTISIAYCISVKPLCNGRPNPTPSGSGIDFEALLSLTSSAGSDSISLNLTDLHTTEAIITAELDIPDNNPEVNPNGTYGFTNTVTITNNGTGAANNVNFNMGLGSFLNNRLTLIHLT